MWKIGKVVKRAKPMHWLQTAMWFKWTVFRSQPDYLVEKRFSLDVIFQNSCTLVWYGLDENCRNGLQQQQLSTMSSVASFHRQGEVQFFPYNDVHDVIQCSTALLWLMVLSWELELTADVTAGWKQRRSMSTHPSRNTINTCFKRCETHWMFSGVLSCTDTKTRS